MLVATVRAYLGHEHDLVALTGEGTAEPFFALATVILPGVVEEIDAVIDSLRDDVVGILEAVRRSEMISAETNGRNLHTGFPQRTFWNLPRAAVPACCLCICHLVASSR